MTRNIISVLVITCIYLLVGCRSYFANEDKLKISYHTISQNSRVIMLSSKEDEKLKIVARMTYLNDVDNAIYNNREYFFLEIFNDEEDVILPDSMQITMFDKEPIWIRKVNSDELDDVLTRDNILSSCYLLAFRKLTPVLRKKMTLNMYISNFGKGVFDFSFVVLKTNL